MKYYLTADKQSLEYIDLWKDYSDPLSDPNEPHVQHVKRLKGRHADEVLFSGGGALHTPSIKKMKPFIIEQSEDLEELVIMASLYALG